MYGKRIKEALRAKGKSVATLAEALEVTEQSVYRYLRDEVEPSISTVMKIAEFTGYSYLFFLAPRGTGASSTTTLRVYADDELALELPLTRGLKVSVTIE